MAGRDRAREEQGPWRQFGTVRDTSGQFQSGTGRASSRRPQLQQHPAPPRASLPHPTPQSQGLEGPQSLYRPSLAPGHPGPQHATSHPCPYQEVITELWPSRAWLVGQSGWSPALAPPLRNARHQEMSLIFLSIPRNLRLCIVST